ncbi:hypothetical protein HK097_010890 [Rhizophlyctis rosea]|uniref:G-patch domain-containing protein n=1 Tax=Rhizophlyctis rosea TaxID=64517 RepID=A0AAD5X7X1_9FUNG|nr:hypothetical protein HK097_010890 [Rhizophlyctis rosea]
MAKRSYNLSFANDDEEEESSWTQGNPRQRGRADPSAPTARTPQNDSFVRMGTEQPISASEVRARDRNKFLPVHLQEVRDEKGRKRLHGAFTGGFSAGYFNTVGSKEGWQPSQFISSRSSRGGAQPEQRGSRPEDFMDEEDLADLASTKQVAATEEFDILGGTERELARRNAAAKTVDSASSAVGPLPGKLVEDLIGPPKDPVGIKLLRQMGWREGHGVGPRAKRKRTAGADEDIHAAEHLFAPKNATVVRLVAKADVFGIGFNPFKNAPEFAGRSGAENISDRRLNEGAAKKAKTSGPGGFGVGIFEEDDDEDVYGGGSTGFNIIIDDDEDGVFSKRLSQLTGSKSAQKWKDGRQSIPTSDSRLCSDGRPPLRGFALAQVPLVEAKRYPPPKVPDDFIPLHRFESDAPPPVVAGPTGPHVHPSRQQQHQQLSADQRRDLLGEEALRGPSRSVFSYLPIKEQDRLQQFIDKATAQKQKGQETVAEKAGVPVVGKDVALAALKGFMPFGNDLEKQRRYRRFLEVQAELATDYIEPPKHLNATDRDQEPREFAQAAMLYRPLSTMMASRFTSSSEMAPEKGGLSTADEMREHSELAASSNMYGRLTRSVVEWRPVALLCKRFNVPDPYAKKKGDTDTAPKAEDVAAEKEVLNPQAMEQLMMERDRRAGFAGMREGEVEGSSETETLTREPVGSVELDVVAEDDGGTGEPQRPPMDIFKAIFADSDSEESSDEEDGPPKAQTTLPPSFSSTDVTIPSRAAPPSEPKAKAPEANNVPLPPPTFRPLFRRKEDRGKELTVRKRGDEKNSGDGIVPEKSAEIEREKNGEGNAIESKAASPVESVQLALVPATQKVLAETSEMAPARKPTRPSSASKVVLKHLRDSESSLESTSSSSSEDDSDDDRRDRKRRKKDSSSSHKKKKKKDEGKKKKKKEKDKRKHRREKNQRKAKKARGDDSSPERSPEREQRFYEKVYGATEAEERKRKWEDAGPSGVGAVEGTQSHRSSRDGSQREEFTVPRRPKEPRAEGPSKKEPSKKEDPPRRGGRASAADFM